MNTTEAAMSSQLLIVASTFLAAYAGFGALGLAYAGPVAIVAGLVAVYALQRRTRFAWPSIGLAPSGGIGRFAGRTLVALFAGWTAALAATLLATRGFGWAAIDTSRFAGIEGNATVLLGALAISWTTAAFGEELLFRGFLQSRLRMLFGRMPPAGVLAAVVQAVIFSVGHAYQGATGLLVSGAIGLAFGLLMLRFRSVWPLVVAHGLIDTTSMLALYAGARPG